MTSFPTNRRLEIKKKARETPRADQRRIFCLSSVVIRSSSVWAGADASAAELAGFEVSGRDIRWCKEGIEEREGETETGNDRGERVHSQELLSLESHG